MIRWPIVTLIDHVAWLFGYQVYVVGQAGPGWHRGRIGPDRIHFIRAAPGARRLKKLKPARW